MPPAMLEAIAARFKAMGEPMRLRILALLLDGDHNVNELAAALGATQSNTSRHLQALREAGLIDRRKEGLLAIYFVADPIVSPLCELMCARELARAEETWKEIRHAN